MSRIRVLPDHEPGTDCPKSPGTCFVCQPKVDRLKRARDNCAYVRLLMREREPKLYAALELAVRRG